MVKENPSKDFHPLPRPKKLKSIFSDCSTDLHEKAEYFCTKPENRNLFMEQLKLENQICFPLYAASRLVTREYQPHLDQLGITYPQYLVLLVLWQQDQMPVNDIARKLILNTNTITPLLKRMEQQGLITRKRSQEDERVVLVSLSEKGKQLQEKAAEIPAKLVAGLSHGQMPLQEIILMKNTLTKLIDLLIDQEKRI